MNNIRELGLRSIYSVLFVLLALCVNIAHAATQPVVEAPRVALVIGNGAYPSGALRNPRNDARAVAAKLDKLGFKVILREDQNREAMHQAISEFGKQIREGGVGLFYYAGHGMQIKGRNFLIPVDADIQHEDDIEFRGIDANMVLARMEAAHTRINLVVLDACRNNPFSRFNRSGSAGLVQMDAPKGSLIAFSTAPGSLAKDGSGPNSVYTKHLIQKLDMPGMPVEQIFKEVRIAVTQETHDKQIPWESSSLMGEFYFVPPTSANAPILNQAAPTVAEPAVQMATRGSEPAKPQALTAPVAQKPKAPENHARDYNREGYEIELRAKNLTSDELPALEAKAKQGDVIAQTTLGWAYLLGKGLMDGRGIPRNNPKMLKWTKAAAKQGYPVAQNNLGAIYMDGIGVKLDYPQAQYYFKLAADQGYLAAQNNLLQVSTMLSGKLDTQQVSAIIKNIQQQWGKPVQ